MAKRARQGRSDAIGDPIIPLIRKARQQIEAEPGAALGWLVRFVREDPERWLPGDMEAHGYRLLALVYGPIGEHVLQRGAGHIPPITPTSVVEIHAELAAFFSELVSGPAPRTVKVPTDDLGKVLIRASAPGEKPAIFGISRGGPRRTLLFQAVEALVLASDRLMACPGPKCGKPFLALRKKKFCDSDCLQSWHDERRPKKRGRR